MLKNLVLALLLVLPISTSAQLSVPQGGTGRTTFTGGDFLYANTDPLFQRITGTSSPYFANFTFGNATGTSATTTNLFATNATLSNLSISTTTLSGFTNGSILFATSSGVISQDNSNLFWDDSNNRLGIGTASPAGLLHIKTSSGADNLVLQAWSEAGVDLVEFGLYGDFAGTGSTGNAIRFGSASSGWASNIMTLMGDGNVGIGTNAPQALLHLWSNGDNELILEADADNSGENDNARVVLRQDGNLINGILGMVGDAGALYTGSLSNAFYIEAQDVNNANAIQFVTGGDVASTPTIGVARMTINQNGNVGIATTTPNAKLHVTQASAANAFLVEDQTADPSPFVINAAGLVGIGTASPSYPIHSLTATGDSVIQVETDGTDGEANIRFENDARSWKAGVNSSDQFQIRDNTASLNRFIISTAGNVGIGANSPSTLLHMAATSADAKLRIENSGNGNESMIEFSRERLSGTGSIGGAIWISSDTATNNAELWFMSSTASAGPSATGPAISILDNSTGANNNIKFWNDGSTLMTILGDGKVGIGTTTPSSALHVNGTTTATCFTTDGTSCITGGGGGSITYNNGTTTVSASSTATTTIAHGLGATPDKVRIISLYASGGSQTNEWNTEVIYSNSRQSATYKFIQDNVSGAGFAQDGFAFQLGSDGASIRGTISVDSTNITISWSINGSGWNDTTQLMWEAET